MKDLLQRVRVDVRTSNIKIAAKRPAARAALLFFLIQPIKLLFVALSFLKFPIMEFKKLRRQLQRKHYHQIELCVKLSVLRLLSDLGHDRKSMTGQDYFAKDK